MFRPQEGEGESAWLRWSQADGLPPWDRGRDEHLEPALRQAMAEHESQVQAITQQAAEPDVENTLAALDRSGRSLARLEAVFHTLCATRSTPQLQQALANLVPDLAEHHQRIRQSPALFQRVQAIWQQCQQRQHLGVEEAQLAERWWRDMVMAGAGLPPQTREQAMALQRELAALSAQFSQNVLVDQSSFVLPLRHADEVEGLPPPILALARQQAAVRGLTHPYGVVTLSPALYEGFLRHAKRRDLREVVWRAWTQRAAQVGPQDNRALVHRMVALRQRWARLLGFEHYAQAMAESQHMASVPQVWSLLRRVWDRVLAHHHQERAQWQGWWGQDPIAPWDWLYVLQACRTHRGAPEDQALRPYLSLDGLLHTLFELSGRLFALRFERRDSAPRVHASVQTWAVLDQQGTELGWLTLDLWARPDKRPGSWMSALNWQHDNPSHPQDSGLPLVQITASWAVDEAHPHSLGPEEAPVLFHEFGHALHALLSRVRFAGLSGTRVPRDVCEWPSQWMERWVMHDTILRSGLRHRDTGEPMPAALARRWQQTLPIGRAGQWLTYLASAVMDLAVHSWPLDQLQPDPQTVAHQLLADWGLPAEIRPVHDLPHFLHIFGGQDYDAAYYSYLWSDILAQSVFDRLAPLSEPVLAEVASSLRHHLLGVGHSRPFRGAFEAFLGQAPEVEDWLVAMGWGPLDVPRGA